MAKQPNKTKHVRAGKSPMKQGTQAKSSTKFKEPNFAPLKLVPDNEKNKSEKKGRK